MLWPEGPEVGRSREGCVAIPTRQNTKGRCLEASKHSVFREPQVLTHLWSQSVRCQVKGRDVEWEHLRPEQ